jgi:amino acid adenylation domain-containing protein
LLSSAERELLLVEWNNTAAKFPREIAIHRLFERQAQQIPAARAITDGTTHFTYQQVNERANRLARYLQRAGVAQGSFVGLYLERSADLIVTLLAILKAGGAYVPLDQSYPKERLAFMLDDAQVQVLVTESRFASNLPRHAKTRCLYLDRDKEEIARECPENLSTEIRGKSPAYVIYTSGSTGKPKGVVVTHRAVNRLVINTNYVQLTPGDVMAQLSNSSFDAATWEIWGSLLNGARLVIISKETALCATDFTAAIREHGVTTAFLTTALFNQHIAHRPETFKGLRHVMVGGEAADVRSFRECLQHGAPQNLWNAYGPTERQRLRCVS